MEWVRCSERMPSLADAECTEYILSLELADITFCPKRTAMYGPHGWIWTDNKEAVRSRVMAYARWPKPYDGEA